MTTCRPPRRARPRRRRHAEERQHGGCHVHDATVAGDEPSRPDAGAGGDQRRPRLEDVQRAVLAAVGRRAVRGGVQHAQVGRARVIEDLGDPLVGQGVAVAEPCGLPHRQLLGERRQPSRVLDGERVAAGHPLHLVGPAGPCRAFSGVVAVGGAVAPAGRTGEAHAAVDRTGLVEPRFGRGDHHLHDRLQVRGAEDVEGACAQPGIGGAAAGAAGATRGAGADVGAGGARRAGRGGHRPDATPAPVAWCSPWRTCHPASAVVAVGGAIPDPPVPSAGFGMAPACFRRGAGRLRSMRSCRAYYMKIRFSGELLVIGDPDMDNVCVGLGGPNGNGAASIGNGHFPDQEGRSQ